MIAPVIAVNFGKALWSRALEAALARFCSVRGIANRVW